MSMCLLRHSSTLGEFPHSGLTYNPFLTGVKECGDTADLWENSSLQSYLGTLFLEHRGTLLLRAWCGHRQDSGHVLQSSRSRSVPRLGWVVMG